MDELSKDAHCTCRNGISSALGDRGRAHSACAPAGGGADAGVVKDAAGLSQVGRVEVGGKLPLGEDAVDVGQYGRGIFWRIHGEATAERARARGREVAPAAR